VYVSLNENFNFHFFIGPIPLHEVTSIHLEQQSISSTDTHALRFYINGTVVSEAINNNARAFQNVLVYGSAPWYPSANVTISDFRFGHHWVFMKSDLKNDLIIVIIIFPSNTNINIFEIFNPLSAGVFIKIVSLLPNLSTFETISQEVDRFVLWINSSCVEKLVL